MSIRKQLSVKNNFHHAYLIEGEPEKIAPEILSVLEELGIMCMGNPDVCQEFFETLSINDSRALKELSVEKSTLQGDKFFIIGSYFFTREAQNALLKILEEPAPKTHFFLITPNPELLLPTVKSRMVFVRETSRPKIKEKYLKQAEEFLKITKSARITEIEKLVKKYKDKDGDEESSLKKEALSLINAIEFVLYEKTKDQTRDYRVFQELHLCRDYLFDRGASIKMLLEHLALILKIF